VFYKEQKLETLTFFKQAYIEIWGAIECGWGCGSQGRERARAADWSAADASSLVLLAALLLVLALLLRRGVLVLLVLRDQVVHVRLGLGELHLVHALARVPVEERLAGRVGCARSVRRDRERVMSRLAEAIPGDYNAQAVAQDPARTQYTASRRLKCTRETGHKRAELKLEPMTPTGIARTMIPLRIMNEPTHLPVPVCG
jgi:hypothetical protein